MMVTKNMSENAVVVENLVKKFEGGGVIAVDDITFDVPKGEIVCLLGPSGCGKTTTLRSIAGVETIDEGTIDISGEVVSSDSVSESPEDRNIGMVFQNYAIWPDKTVYQNVVFPLKYASDMDPEEYDERVMEVLELVEIPELRDAPATDLSGGQQQRTALARALVHDPDVLLLDEPLSNLDAKLRTTMRNELQKIQHEIGTTMLYVTHDQEEAFYLADKVIIMKNGKIVEQGSPVNLYNTPEKSFTRSFVGRWNQFSGDVKDGEIKTDIGSFSSDNVGMTIDELTTHIELFLRPTDVNIVQQNETTDGLIFDGTIVAGGLIGELYELVVELSTGRELIIQSSDHLEIDRGRTIQIHVDPTAFQMYRMD